MAVQASDIVMTVLVFVVMLGLSPAIYDFINAAASSTGLLTRLILAISVPLLFVMLLMSAARAGRSAR